VSTALPAPRVIADPFSRGIVRNVLFVAGGAALIGLCAQLYVYLPGNPVPITGQTFAVLFVAAGLGLARGVSATMVYAVGGLVGVPWFAQGSSGLVTASFGYILGFILAAAVVGYLAERGWTSRAWRTVVVMVLGNVVIYVVGVTWLKTATGMGWSKAISLGMTPFLVGDAIKIALAAGAFTAAWAIIRRRRQS
jgi:biotin transport system substrate-specific component